MQGTYCWCGSSADANPVIVQVMAIGQLDCPTGRIDGKELVLMHSYIRTQGRQIGHRFFADVKFLQCL